jgi:hypothetical protein
MFFFNIYQKKATIKFKIEIKFGNFMDCEQIRNNRQNNGNGMKPMRRLNKSE